MVLLDEGDLMTRAELLDATENILNKAGFQVSQRCTARASCFDFATRRNDQLVFIKALVNIGNVSCQDASELRRISKCFSATALFIGDKTRGNLLEDDTVYVRYSIYAITPKTLGNSVFLQMYPLIEAGPGGYYVNLDGDVIRKRRQELGLSVGKLAELMTVSRRTVYGYEKGMSKASVSAAYNLEWVLGAPVAQPINPFQSVSQDKGFLAAAKRVIVRNNILQMVLGKLTRFNFKVALTKRAPFDFIAQCPKGQLCIVGGVICEKEQNINRRTEEILSVSEVANAQPIFVTDGKKIPNNKIPLIHCEELSQINCPEDLTARL